MIFYLLNKVIEIMNREIWAQPCCILNCKRLQKFHEKRTANC